MESETIAGLSLYYDEEDYEAARLIGAACEKSVQLVRQHWGVAAPADCRVYVMASWPRFLFHAAPGLWKVYLALIYPLIARQARAIWPHAGGWALPIGSRRVVGIKPPRLMETANQSLGEQIFLQNRDSNEKAQTATCHELVHAFIFHLRLPAWLHEGLATLAMEHYLERRIVRADTLEKIAAHSPQSHSSEPEKLRVEQPQALIAIYARGYWLTRYIEETRPELLKALLVKRQSQKEFAEMVASAYGKDSQEFWTEIDSEVKSWYQSTNQAG